ncbi:hypothetical protein D3C72_1777470 [compost metagenome]
MGANISSKATASAPTTPVSWVFAPAASATGVRDALLLIGKPWKNPAARLAAPRPTISWFGSTRVLVRAAKVRDSTLVSANEISATAMPPSRIATRSAPLTQGTTKPGSPCGVLPSTFTPFWSRSNMLTASVATITAIRMPGTRSKRFNNRISTRLPAPTAKLYQLVSPARIALPRLTMSRSGPASSSEMANSFGNWLTSTVSAIPFIYP